nr:hypothetical protein [Geobacter sp.]
MSVFGPVPSRRLGRSLGVDTIPAKACSYSCVKAAGLCSVKKAIMDPPEFAITARMP